MSTTTHEIALDTLDSLSGLDALLLFVSEEDRPLPGTAGLVDWRLCGALSRVLQNGFFVGAWEDCLLVPADGRMALPRVFVFGAGHLSALNAERLRAMMASAASVLRKAGIESTALEVPGAGQLPDEVRVRALTESFIPAFRGRQVAILADKAFARLFPDDKKA